MSPSNEPGALTGCNPGVDNKLTAGLSPEQLVVILRDFEPAALKAYGTKGLTSIKAQYVIERLNEVFGTGQWNAVYDIVHMGTFPGMDTSTEGAQAGVIMRCSLFAPGIRTVHHFGGALMRAKQDMNDVFKSAATDGLTKCASQLGIGNNVFKGLVQPPKSGNAYYKPQSPIATTASGGPRYAAAPPKQKPPAIETANQQVGANLADLLN